MVFPRSTGTSSKGSRSLEQHHAGPVKLSYFTPLSDQDPYARGGYSLFVPESYDPDHPLPLVVALHGGYGHGRDFLWTWLREARSRGFILMAPSSIGRTWSIADIPMDARQLNRHVEEVCSRFTIEANRILMTGMSDGGTFALGFGFQKDCPAKAIAPVSCVLPPVNLELAGDRRVYWVHGAQDWMFPVGRAVTGMQGNLFSRRGREAQDRAGPLPCIPARGERRYPQVVRPCTCLVKATRYKPGFCV